MVNTVQNNRKLSKVKVRFTLRAGMVKVGNQGLDERYIRLQSHGISYPVVSGLRQSHSITFSSPGARFSKDPVTKRTRNHILKSKFQEK